MQGQTSPLMQSIQVKDVLIIHPAGECPVCKKKFHEGDDIVICPSCGAPYHRHCYVEAGHCLFSEQHSPGFEYKAPVTEQTKKNPSSGNSGGILCQNCQTVNDARNIFCENCGSPLHTAAKEAQSAGVPPVGGYPPTGETLPPPAFRPGMAGFYQQPSFAGEISGIPAQDWADYIGPSAPIYLQRMAIMEKYRYKISFMISAFLFGPCYFAYRKMWGWAAITLFLSLALFMPEMLWVSAQAGTPLLPAVSIETLDYISTAAKWLSLGVQVFTGVYALTLFQKHAVKQISAIRKTAQGNDYRNQLAHRGGISILGLLASIAIMVAFFFVLRIFMGDALMAYYTSLLYG